MIPIIAGRPDYCSIEIFGRPTENSVYPDIYQRPEVSLWQELYMEAVEKEGTKPQEGPMRFPSIAGYPFFLGLMVIAPY